MSRDILLIENQAFDFFYARIPYAKYLINNGWRVFALIPRDEIYSELIKSEGVEVIDYDLDRLNKGIYQLLKLLFLYRRILNTHNFDVIHSYRFQPNLMNALIGNPLRYDKIIHVTGLGIAFSNSSTKYKLYKLISQIIYFVKFISVSKIIFQNPDDVKDVWSSKFFSDKAVVILGSGVSTSRFSPNNFDKLVSRASLGIDLNIKLFICVTRLIWEKGIKELCEAFGEEYRNNPDIKLFIVGSSDFENPRHIPVEFIKENSGKGGIVFLGSREDIPQLLACADIFILPSYYREGIPRALLEALATGLPIITTDMPGCRITVSSENGVLIKPQSVFEIKRSIRLILTEDLNLLGYASRKKAVELFSEEEVFSQMLRIYK